MSYILHPDFHPDFRPMLACPCKDMAKIQYPVLGTPKMDGIRCITREKKELELIDDTGFEAVSRFGLPIPNRHIQKILSNLKISGLDGELLTYDNGKLKKYNPVQSDVMSGAGEPEFLYHVFDVISEKPYIERMIDLSQITGSSLYVETIMPTLIESELQLRAFDRANVEAGWEGSIIRSVDSPYKFGRATWKQGWMIKIKEFLDAEATVTGFEELMRNGNEATRDELGLTKRSSHLSGLVPANTLGALACISDHSISFNIGTGFDNDLRKEIWDNKEKYLGKKVKFKYQPHGEKDAPRCPVFLGFRDERDMDAGPFTTTEETE